MAGSSAGAPPRSRRARCARALEPPAVRLLREFVGVPQGVKFVVDLRAELLALGKSDAAARALSEDLRPLLGAWFDVGFLDLVRIDWQPPAALLEKLVAYEAVHAIRSLARPQEPARFRPPLLRLLPSAHARRAADLRRGGAGQRHGGQRAAPARRARRDARSARGQHGDLLFDLQLPAGAGRHQLRQLPDQAGGRPARRATCPTSRTSRRCRRSPACASISTAG